MYVIFKFVYEVKSLIFVQYSGSKIRLTQTNQIFPNLIWINVVDELGILRKKNK